ncbi:Kinesin-like protein [Phytophthora cactorum]|uniref:Kinesin-like calmodulin-binding protein n=1 Tax=Phytophthora cactorum TaxID=29920 RepID=A0A329RUT0_9STRA|nr:Kinesin-like protein [Phytophthora cactorum]KAG2816300.1 Kinesin-like protein [Phytophthora cactorum]KAG2826442.1 Kinesin-like protein [Phytophthora cactorum]KAG2857486.1 Kinesin-like protein [Phytophthora cactorum]KAG2906707.1 Kinesin-like protein [Phytophthora cactorum]
MVSDLSSATESPQKVEPSQELLTTSSPVPGSKALVSTSSLVQVAPLPLTTDFHAGKVLELGVMPPAPLQEREEAYIPVALARAQLGKVVADMHAMKAEQVQKLNEILEHYRSIEKDTRERHEARVRALKDRAEAKLKESRELHVQLEKAGVVREELHAKEKQALLAEQEKQRLNHLEAHEDWRREFECALQAHEDESAKGQKAALDEIERVSRAANFTGEKAQQQLRNELQMCSEDALGQAMRVGDQLQSARLVLERQHQAFLNREVKLRRHFAGLLEVERFIYTLIDTVVDSKQQTIETKRAESLQNKLRDLETKAKAACSREEILERRLQAARERFASMEAQAVRETVELLVHAVAVTIEGADKAPPATSDAPTQTQDVEEEPKEAEEAVVVTDTEGPTLLLDKNSYESDVEVARERNVALLRSKQELHEAKEKLENLTKAKKVVKTAVKTWLTAFQSQFGREPTIEDKAQVKDKYLAFKDAEKAFSTQKALVQTLKQQHRELALRIGASSRWSALGSAVAKSARTARIDDENGVESPLVDSSCSTSEQNSQAASQAASRPLSASVSTQDVGIEAVVLTKESGTDAASDEFKDEAVATLEELQELRSQLAVANAPQPAIEYEDKTREHKPSIPAAPTALPSPQQLQGASADEVAGNPSYVEPLVHEEAEPVSVVGQEEATSREQELDRQQQQRLALQEEISGLSREIEQRRAEKTRLESEIEQLRLHLELSEARDSDLFPPSEAKFDRIIDDLEAKAIDELEPIEQEEEYEEEQFEAAPKDDEDESTEQTGDDEKEEPEENESQEVKEDAARSLQLVQMIIDAVARGKAQFNRGDKAKCYQTYAKCAEKCMAELQALHDKQRRQLAPALKRVMAESARLPPARGPQALRKQLDIVRDNCEEWLNTREEQAVARLAERNGRKEAKAAMKKQQILEKKQAEQKNEEKKHYKKKTSPPQNTSNGTPLGGGNALEDAKQKLRALEAKAKADRVKISQLEAALAKAETQVGNGSSNIAGNGSAASDRRVVDMEKKHKKTLEDNEKAAKKEIAALTQQLQAAQKASQELQDQTSALQKELGVAGGKAKQLGQLELEVNQLREQAALVTPLNNELRDAKAQYTTLETSYREEQALRKKYYNQIEDMKGKIRVYARCRPMSGSENERGCITCVKFIDEFSLEVSGGNRATKTFAYDQVFSPASTQKQVFEDTKNLLRSAVDGYNVCIFAYGQTGSGKTFTMTGSEGDPGLSPRAIHHLFQLAEEGKSNFTVTFQATMLELYNDSLIDLFHLVDGGGAHDNKLEIKKNEKGMVVVQNATLKKCTTPEQTLRLFEAANKKRQVGATKMNAESSRSHSIFSLLVESYNKTTKATTIGKLSLVDLAGSERAGKTGATADRLKEAQAINKSLSALGDVISALSTNEKFIPYRNNKLTQLMQDSLGGNAKTLMFVNISPADYNQEETSTSLTYASRVKLITNSANKNSESEQVNRLKAIIKQLRAGKTDVDLDGVLD